MYMSSDRRPELRNSETVMERNVSLTRFIQSCRLRCVPWLRFKEKFSNFPETFVIKVTKLKGELK